MTKTYEQAEKEVKRMALQCGGGPEYVREDANGYYNYHTGERLTEDEILEQIPVDDMEVRKVMGQ